jgi:hypothetical protein
VNNPVAARIIDFLAAIGMPVREEPLPGPTFLPGVTISRGVLVIDEARLLYPGDILHEAGHLAILTPSARAAADGDIGDDGGMEMAAIAWSYAAALHLSIDPSVVFHAAGYHAGSQNILENFAAGRYVGVPILEWAGMTAARGERPFPFMSRWLRAEPDLSPAAP